MSQNNTLRIVVSPSLKQDEVQSVGRAWFYLCYPEHRYRKGAEWRQDEHWNHPVWRAEIDEVHDASGPWLAPGLPAEFVTEQGEFVTEQGEVISRARVTRIELVDKNALTPAEAASCPHSPAFVEELTQARRPWWPIWFITFEPQPTQ